ncbi:iron-sulfur cluster insertion protein ErpA [Rhodovibrio salinarum]|uniref:Iron-sulfur cluster insertion protein ErpA n=2 Tax=Rhodovibrio salinarum TaxID=1087 RepID=A0A934QJ26_9PROT|nr:iron-sulfur cluster insertion protein ErpA [Rhodovibrio salinarum]
MRNRDTAGEAPSTVEAGDGSLKPISITEAAAKRIAFLIEQEGDRELMLRVSVSGGGCSGFRYGFDFDKQINDDDHTFTRDGVKIVIDEVSLELLGGSELHYVDDLIGSYFEVRNPNASSSCGCGASFSI